MICTYTNLTKIQFKILIDQFSVFAKLDKIEVIWRFFVVAENKLFELLLIIMTKLLHFKLHFYANASSNF